MHRNGFVISVALLSVSFWLNSTNAQGQEKVVIPLRLNLEIQQASGWGIASRINDGPITYTTAAGDGLGYAPDKVLFKLQPVGDSPNAYHLFIDSNGDGDLRNETPQTLLPNSFSVTKINRKWANGKQSVLPYSIKYSRDADSKGQMRERFLWLPHYRAEGRMQIGKCENLLAVLDLSTDGQFDDADLSAGSSIGLDRNGDGRTWPHAMSGRGEADPLWKMFGGMEGNRLAIPLYVVVDSEGCLRYAANGGEDLSELRTVIKSLLR